MKAVILAGGFGTRLSEETEIKPKPMVEIGGKPMLWHVMKIFSHYGINEFIILLGYKSYMVKEYFANYFLHQSDVTIDLKSNSMKIHKSQAEPWKITLLDTGLKTMTGGRVKRAKDYIGDETFMLTYGDGVADVNIKKLLEFHKKNKKLATVTSIMPSGRYGAIDITDKNEVKSFFEKPKGDGSWINGGFFVLEPKVLDYIDGDKTIFEREPLQNIVKDGQLNAFKHDGFWQAMDTLREKNDLEKMWAKEEAPWKVWKD
ncbi:MAG: glucose-1-phosphate cytidylyltransferase [Elusimicrobiaceae bacterium]|jgi:glucose-1-phosphate cytidylyltransferase|nr:glucose-1-phosphate cytidylyltransferase [Elusimicrobiaceae bacterium]MBT3954936.1 glucose-1-phosphate cytidylyltransferase [Elusimicrobiaceae bacterium]MBT4008586.1 glucose-1-phosphate cytidylyltransferase [Elusimicrobiaceae bacterium]MBT4402976.1 glucose-1-phosphate cytidylyltransferase [Elusimicrobiaceae bacterium]MBT4439752.1 glucose-1-phosphate cytidylyltransferase [Elusimicrobiaceae bacterium]